ncbi:NAD-dependent epimerase/dehydratase family protein [Thioalkalivibrio thiocyanoxidans]|uniref:NAD-dependent epimerase/dehydratase family protein n=1 Tax=Thioalkalivibrio thiocyanoxidans TaxID=152475 RepID=UPI00037D1567|nr:NAD-dependent epimerase/dehydratase family protein [Thioalkalivibrio thiocyanoxidans]
MTPPAKPIIVITGAAGNIGSALIRGLQSDYFVVGLDLVAAKEADLAYTVDLTSEESVSRALEKMAQGRTRKIAAVIHLAAYFDFTGEDSPAYQAVNVDGTRNLLKALQNFEVERFIYSSTMLVHAPTVPGHKITEDSPLGPRWVYPQSKLDAEAAIEKHAGDIPYTLLRLAGLYDEQTCVPTLAHQIARIYERDMESHLGTGDTSVGQAFVHVEDMIDAFLRTVERRTELPQRHALLIGENHTESYEALQNRIAALLHGVDDWRTIVVPGPLAKTGAWMEEKLAPVIPEDFEKGRTPFIRPFMIDLASDHYDLDVSRAEELVGWRPRHYIYDGLAKITANLKEDPATWYTANRIDPPHWVDTTTPSGHEADKLRHRHETAYAREHYHNIWAPMLTVGLGGWLVTSPATLGYDSTAMAASDIVAGLVLTAFALLSLSVHQRWARWASAAVGVWLLFAPLVFWVPSAAAYLNGTLVGMLVIGLAAAVRPAPGISPVAATTGPTAPPGWNNNPSDWFQRIPVIALAFVGFFLARHMAAYQLGHIDAAWEPFFAGTRPGLSGTEDVVTSEVSEAWPIPDAGLGAIVYALEILIGLMGAANRWRTMPWVVAAFGVLIVPLGIVSITFIIIQPIVIGTWCTPCLIAAAAMLLQIAYASNEFVASGEFLYRRYMLGRPVLKIFFVGDTDTGRSGVGRDDFRQPALQILKQSFGTGVGLPWNLALCMLIGGGLMLTRVTLGHDGGLADWDHLIGAMVITAAAISMGEVARPVRFLIIPLALPLFVTPFIYGAGALSIVASLASAVALIALCIRRGPIRGRYGHWTRWIV